MRLSAAIFLVRLLGTVKVWPVRLVWLLGGLNFASAVVIEVVYGTQCIPFSGTWNKAEHPKCYSLDTLSDVLKFYGSESSPRIEV